MKNVMGLMGRAVNLSGFGSDSDYRAGSAIEVNGACRYADPCAIARLQIP